MRQSSDRARPIRTSLTATAWMFVAVAGGCTSDREMTGPSDVEETPGLVVSSLSAPRTGAGSAGGAALVTTVVYVSLVSGTARQGVRADIRNVSTGLAKSVPMQDGGFDPVQVPAEEGHTIEVTVHEADGGTQRFTSTAKPFRNPAVVRSGPTRGATDVPLNPIIIIIFSEPMDPETVEDVGMRLVGPGGLVPLTVELGADGLTAVATPTEPLELASTYTLVVDTSATSAKGVSLEEGYQTEFTTIELPVSFVLGFGSDADTVQAGGKIQLWIGIWDSNTGEKVDLPVQWSSLDPSIARVDSTGLVHGIGVGDVQVAATLGGFGPVPFALRFTPLVFSAVSAGGAHTCGITTEGTAFCWGSNSSGQLGTGTLEATSIPAPVAGDLRFSSVAAGAEHTCGIATDGLVYCWGSDEFWQLGRLDRQAPGTPATRLAPTLFPHGPLTGVTASGRHTCARDTAGVARCWGAYSYGERTLYLDGPRVIEGGSIASLAGGGEHSCGIADGAGFCWGRNDRGQLGDGSLVSRPPLAETVDTLSRPALGSRIDDLAFSALSAGLEHTCGLVGGRAYCWGDAGDGRLGVGTGGSTSFVSTPTAVTGGLSFLSIGLGGRHTCAIATSGRPFCWGFNTVGQLGTGTRDARVAPALVAEGLRLTALTVGSDHTCGLASDGLLYCWGRSMAGEMGTGFTGVHDIPTRVALQR